MPHKRNPVACAAILSAAIRVPGLVATILSAMPQEHERGLGGWQAEWETLPEIFDLTFTALDHTIEIIEGFEIDAKRMAANLNGSHGLIMAEAVSMTLAQFVGKAEAHRIVEQACHCAQRDAKPLLDILAEDANVRAHLSTSQLNEIMNPANYLGATVEIIERVLQKGGRDLMCIPLDLDATFGNADRRFGTHGLVICVSSPIFSGDFLSDRV